jgi:hypothetical protein
LTNTTHVKPLPEISHIPLDDNPATLIAVAEPYWASVREPVVPALERFITSEVIAIVQAAAAMFIKVIAVPIGNATEDAAGMVKVRALLSAAG